MKTNLDMDVLRTFALGMEFGSFAKAADRIGRSQSAVSTQLRRLEDQIGAPLVRKHGRRLATTEAGEALLGYARRILDLNDEALETIRGTSAAGLIRLGLPQDFAEAWLSKALVRFARASPNMRLEVKVERTSVLVEAVARGHIDLALTWGGATEGASAEIMAELDMAWIGPATRLLSNPDPLPIVAFEQPCVFRSAGLAALDRAGIAWRIAFTSPSLTGLWAASEAGLGVTPRTLVGVPDTLRAIGRQWKLPSLPKVPLAFHRSSATGDAGTERLAAILRDIVQTELAADGKA